MEETVFILSKYHFVELPQALPHSHSERDPRWGWPPGLSSSSWGPSSGVAMHPGSGEGDAFLLHTPSYPRPYAAHLGKIIILSLIPPDVHPPSWDSWVASVFLGLSAASYCPTQVPKRSHVGCLPPGSTSAWILPLLCHLIEWGVSQRGGPPCPLPLDPRMPRAKDSPEYGLLLFSSGDPPCPVAGFLRDPGAPGDIRGQKSPV